MNSAGLSPNNPLKYLGPNVNLVTCVSIAREPTGADYRQPQTGKLYPIGSEWIVAKNPTTGTQGDIWFLRKIVANVAYWVQISLVDNTLTADTGGPLSSVANNFNIFGQQAGSIPVVDTIGSGNTISIEDRTSTTAYVVDSSNTAGLRGTFTTIQSAITAAPAGSTVFIRSGTYTENVTLKAGVNLAAYGNSGFTPSVTIIGKLSHTTTGVVTISGIKLQTNGDYAISMTGSAASTSLFLIECNLVAENFAALQMTTSGAGSSIRIVDSWCRTNAVLTNFFVVTGVGGLTFWNVNVIDGGATAQNTPSTFASTGQLLVKYSIIRFPITISGTGRISGTDSEFNTFATNTTPLIVNAISGSTLGNYIRGCILLAGNTTALTVGAGSTVNMLDCTVITTSATPFSGTGTINQAGTSYSTTNAIPSSTTVTLARKAFDPGALWGNWSGVAPAAGYVGEYISSFVPFDGPPVNLTSNVVTVVTSISLTAGTWDVSGIVQFSGISDGTYQVAGFGTSNTVIGNASYGSNAISAAYVDTGPADIGLSIPSFRTNVPSSSTFYLKAQADFTAGTPNAYGRISATRVC